MINILLTLSSLFLLLFGCSASSPSVPGEGIHTMNRGVFFSICNPEEVDCENKWGAGEIITPEETLVPSTK